MDSATPDRIIVRNFSSIFEKMCNFIAVAKTGDPHSTVCGLVKLCLLELPNDHFDGAEPIRDAIETLFGLAIPNYQIETALNDLENENVVTRPGNTNYRLEPSAMEALDRAVDGSQILEDRIKSSWFEQLEVRSPGLPVEDAWKVLRTYLQRTFRRHGIQAAALLDPTVDTPAEHEASLTAILHQAVKEQDFTDAKMGAKMEAAISEFMAALGTDPDRVKYVAQLADAAFNFYTLEVPSDLSKNFRQQLNELTLFLDTNFLFGIFDLHYNTQVQVSHDLLRAISKHRLPFKLRFHEETQKEISKTILHYGNILRSRVWTQSLSRAAATSRNLSGIEQKFHERNAVGMIDVDEWLRAYEHFDSIFAEKGIKLFRAHEQRLEAQNDLFHEYKTFLEKNGRGDKPYETVMHDAKVLEETRNLRTNAASSLEAGALFISCDYFLYRFDWEAARRNEQRACVLLPNIFWQILRPFVPADQNFEKAFAETFALPEFRAIGSGGSRACSKMLQILASYKEVPEPTAMKMLANGLLLDRLRLEHDECKFEEQVEAAFVEENRNLIEEKAALEQELRQLKTREEDKARKRQKELAVYEAKAQELNNGIKHAENQLYAANTAIIEKEHAKNVAEQRARAAEESAEEAQAKASAEAKQRRQAQREAFRMRVLTGISLSVVAVLLFLFLTHKIPWSWLILHENTIPLQIGLSATLVCLVIGFFVTAWRKWCWGVGLLTLFVTVLSLMGK